MFTKQHYIAIATIIKEAEINHPEAQLAMDEVVFSFCQLFKTDNPYFDAGQFLHASIATNRPASLLLEILGDR